MEKNEILTAGKLIAEMRELLAEFNRDNDVSIERIDVEVEEEQKRTLDGGKDIDYNFHMTFKK